MDDKNKNYEEMSPEKREARNRDAFCWKDTDLLFQDPTSKEWLSSEEFLARGLGNNGKGSSKEDLDAMYKKMPEGG
jgi:hypothetical protein